MLAVPHSCSGLKNNNIQQLKDMLEEVFLYSKNSRHDYINLELFHEKLILFLCSVEPCGLNGYKWSRKHIWILWSLQCQEVPTVILCIFSSTLGKMDTMGYVLIIWTGAAQPWKPIVWSFQCTVLVLIIMPKEIRHKKNSAVRLSWVLKTFRHCATQHRE